MTQQLEVAPRIVLAINGSPSLATPWPEEKLAAELAEMEENDLTWLRVLTTEGLWVDVRHSEITQIVDLSATDDDRRSRLAEYQPTSTGVILPNSGITLP